MSVLAIAETNLFGAVRPEDDATAGQDASSRDWSLRWLVGLKVVIETVDKVGIALIVVLASTAPALLLAATPNPVALAATTGRLPWELWCLVVVPRKLGGDFFQYKLGKHAGNRALSEGEPSRPARWCFNHLPWQLNLQWQIALWRAQQFTNWLMGLNEWWMVTVIGLFTFLPFIPFVSVYNVAGISRKTTLWRLAIVDVITTAALLAIAQSIGVLQV